MTSSSLEVWLDSDLCAACQIGSLSHRDGQVRFVYEKDWLKQPFAINIDPSLSLDGGSFYPNAELGNFGVFLDSSPDRWGQTLMKRSEALQAIDEKRTPRTLYAWDYLLGVQDFTRQGALRLRLAGTSEFLGSEKNSAPPMTSLRELESVALELTTKKIEDLQALRRWLAVLVAPGASLGGARPKANFTEEDGTLWIGKFPSRDDDRDIGAWEWLTHEMATQAGIRVPSARRLKLNSPFHTFCVKRFDRVGPARRFYASAMTMLQKEHSEGTSYIDLAEFISTHGNPATSRQDLEQLFRRVVFNVAIGNRDDHLRNHGFILESGGWSLSDAFDVNPNFDKAQHVLNIDEADNRPDLLKLPATAPYYGLSAVQGGEIVKHIAGVVDSWQDRARKAGISAADIITTAAAFSAHTEYRRTHPI